MVGETTLTLLAEHLSVSLRTMHRLRDEGLVQVDIARGRPRHDQLASMERIAKLEAERLRPVLAVRARDMQAKQPAGGTARDILAGSWHKLANDPVKVLAALPVFRDELDRMTSVEGNAILERERLERRVYELEQQLLELQVENKSLNNTIARLRAGV